MDRKLDDETLMRYLDGELDRDESRDAERAVAASPELAAKVQALVQVREVIAARFQAAADEAAPGLDAMWEKIRAGIDTAPAPAKAPARSWWEGAREWLDAHRSHFFTGAVAAAAGALIATFAARDAPKVVEKIVYVPQAPTVVAAAAPGEVESLEVEDGTATILQIPGDRANDPGTTVIWITPNEEGPI